MLKINSEWKKMNRNNNNDKPRLNRREVLKLGAAASAAGLFGMPLGSAAAKPGTEQPKPLGGPGYVVRVHKPGMRGRFFPHPDAAREMVEKAVTRLAGEDNIKKAWSCFIKAEDRVGIKINALAGRFGHHEGGRRADCRGGEGGRCPG